MPFLPRLRLDLALGLLIAGTIWYIGTRPRTRSRDHVRINEEEEDTDSPTAPIVAGALEPLKGLLMDASLLEKIALHADPRTVIRLAQVSKYHQEQITSSPSVQLFLRQYYHQLPPVTNPSAKQRTYLTRQPKKRQLDDLLDREERLSRVRHTKIQRCTMPYIDVLCSGDYTIVTKCLSGRYRQEGNIESGQVEDGYTVMVPRDSLDRMEGEVEDEEVEGGNPRRQDRLEGYSQRTVDVGEEIADIAIRADEDLIILATIVPEDQVITSLPKPKVVRVAFYHLESFTPITPGSEMANPIPHSGAKLQVAEFAFTTNLTSIRLRAGPEGKLLVWAKNDIDKSDTTALIYDWKLGLSIGYAWPGGMREGLPHDFTFFTPDTLILAVLKRVELGTNGYTPVHRQDKTKLEMQTWRLPSSESYIKSTTRLTASREDQTELNGFDMISLSSCRLCSIYKFPEFTHKWKNPTPMEDEVPPEDGQTFSLFHCSIAAKPAPLSYTSDKDSRQGILCITIEGDFGPVIHPNGQPHDHGSIAFCTVSGSTFDITNTNKQPVIYEYKDWNEGNVSWEFGPINTWVTGFGTRTAIVTRYVGISQLMSEDPDFEDEPQRTLVMNVTLRNYDPITVKKGGRITRHPLGRPPIVGGDNPVPFQPTGIIDPNTEPNLLPSISDVNGLDALFDTINELPLNINMNVNVNVPPPPLAMFAATPLHQLSDLIRSMSVMQGGKVFRVVREVSHGFRPEIFGEVEVRSSMPYYEASVSIPIPMPETEEGRQDPATEHPFKTILTRDRLIVCDDGGFDVLDL